MLEVPAVPEVTSRGSGRSATEPVLPQKQRGGEGKRGPEGPRWVARLEGVSWAGPDPPFSRSHQLPQLQFGPMHRDHKETLRPHNGDSLGRARPRPPEGAGNPGI